LSIAAGLLRIDAERAIEDITDYIRRLHEEKGTGGVCFGLSGGIDSSLLAALAAKALGAANVQAMYLYDHDSGSKLRAHARLVSGRLGIQLEEHSIEPELRRRGIYNDLGSRIISISGTLNQLLQSTYRLIQGETPFMAHLRGGAAEAPGGRGNTAVSYAFASVNARHIHRREILEARTAQENLLLLGAANRTEWLVGWFVQGGVDDLPFQPIAGLYKTQVRQLALQFELPPDILTQDPSPDMVKGVNDESGLGMAYAKIDLALDYLAGGLSRDQVLKAGLNTKDIARVREMNTLSVWKRGEHLMPPPVDGGPRGGYRID
jgi:NAD+ synthase